MPSLICVKTYVILDSIDGRPSPHIGDNSSTLLRFIILLRLYRAVSIIPEIHLVALFENQTNLVNLMS